MWIVRIGQYTKETILFGQLKSGSDAAGWDLDIYKLLIHVSYCSRPDEWEIGFLRIQFISLI